MLTFSRRPAAIVVALLLGAASGQVVLAADSDHRSDDSMPEPVALPAGSIAPTAGLADALKRKQTRPPRDSKDDWPTDDFGRPLRSCDVPWDFVPPKE